MSLRVVVAPDSFKGSISATDAAQAIARGWVSVRDTDHVTVLPQADGGEGTNDAIVATISGALRQDAGMVTGPDGTPTPGHWVGLPDGTAVIELATVCGLPLMKALDPLGASTAGLGETVRAALDAGATSLIIGLGGSASTDGGTGALTALGYRFLDAAGTELPPGGGYLARLHTIDTTQAVAPPPGGVVLLTDVTAPLLGPNGAAHVFGPQKGASVADVRLLEMGLTTLTEVAGARALAPAPGAGAAGGTAFGLTALWGGSTGRVRIEPGAAFIARHTRLDELLERADVLITGEGSFDEQSLLGKTVGHAVTVAARHRVRRWVIAGHVASSPGFPPEGCTTLSLTELAGSADAAIASPARFLEWSAARAARATH